MKSALACLGSELEFCLTYLIILIVSVACLYNVSVGTELEFSKNILLLILGWVSPSPRLKKQQEQQQSTT